MPGSTNSIYSGTQTITATVSLTHPPGGAHATATFQWFITAITGTWDIALYATIGGTDVKVAELTGRTTTGAANIPIVSPFTGTNAAIPAPNKIIFTEAVAGTLTSQVWATYGD